MNQFAKIRIEFTGLCSLVPHAIEKKACFVMVDGQRSGIKPLVAEDLPQENRLHWSFLRFPLRTINPNAPTTGEGIWYLRGQRICFKVNSEWEDDPEVQPFKLDLQEKVYQMEDALPSGLAAIDERCLKPVPSQNVGCQVVIDRGTWKADSLSLCDFEIIPTYPSHSPVDPRPYAHKVYTELEQIESLTLIATPFGGSPTPFTLSPTKANDEATLTMANLCLVNPLEWETPVDECKRDIDFAWYYDLLPEGAKTTVAGTLNDQSKGLPIPKLAGVPSLGGDNCNPNQFAAVKYQLA